AEAAFVELGKQHDSRFAGSAPARVADCLWMQDRREEAAKAYRKLLSGKGSFDAAVARFRIADVEAEVAEKAAAETPARKIAAPAFWQINVAFPAPPLVLGPRPPLPLLGHLPEASSSRSP